MTSKYTATIVIGLLIVVVLIGLLYDVAPNIERQRDEKGQEEGAIRLSSDPAIAFSQVYGGLILLGIFLPAGLMSLLAPLFD